MFLKNMKIIKYKARLFFNPYLRLPNGISSTGNIFHIKILRLKNP